MKKSLLLALPCAALGLGLTVAAQRAPQNPQGAGQAQGRGRGTPPPPTARPFAIIKDDPRLDAIIDPTTKGERVGTDFGLNEGAVWVKDGASGYLLFSDMADNVIYKWSPNVPDPISVYLENAGYTGNDMLNVGQQTRRGRTAIILIGPNGLSMDPQGRLVICAMPDRALVRIEKDGTRTVLADKFEGKRFSGPNDVVVKSNGTAYFTDSVSGLRGGGQSAQKELPFNGFYIVKDGKVMLGDEKLRDPSNTGFPNGIALSPDEKYLYVTAGRKVVRYEVQADDTLANPTDFGDIPGSDGMKTDLAGNLYTTTGAGPGEVRIWAPDGKRLGALQLPQTATEPRQQICATNVAFGDNDGKTLYVTACTQLYRIRLKTAGVMPGPKS